LFSLRSKILAGHIAGMEAMRKAYEMLVRKSTPERIILKTNLNQSGFEGAIFGSGQ
jgi:hypothetical protein